jgi:hypothetical protein
MRVLFDQGTPVPLRRSLKGHEVATAREQGWSSLANGALLAAAEQAGFDVLLTTDSNIPYQQNLKNRKLAMVILTRNKWSLVRSKIEEIAAAVDAAEPGSCTIVEIAAR